MVHTKWDEMQLIQMKKDLLDGRRMIRSMHFFVLGFGAMLTLLDKFACTDHANHLSHK